MYHIVDTIASGMHKCIPYGVDVGNGFIRSALHFRPHAFYKNCNLGMRSVIAIRLRDSISYRYLSVKLPLCDGSEIIS